MIEALICTVRLGRINHPQIEWRLFSATTGPIAAPIVAWSPSVSEPACSHFDVFSLVNETPTRTAHDHLR